MTLVRADIGGNGLSKGTKRASGKVMRIIVDGKYMVKRQNFPFEEMLGEAKTDGMSTTHQAGIVEPDFKRRVETASQSWWDIS